MSNKIAASSTVFVIGPAWSNEDANATIPHLDTLPYEGFKPTVPVKEAGCLIEPPVSVPREATQRSPETAAADPPDDPPGTSSLSEFTDFHGFLTEPKKLVLLVEPIANSSQFNLPKLIKPASSQFWVTVDS